MIGFDKNPLINIIIIDTNDKKNEFPSLEVCGRRIPFTLTVKSALKSLQSISDSYRFRFEEKKIDYEAMFNSVRLIHEAKELLSTGFITFPRPERELLIKIIRGDLEVDEVSEMIEKGIYDVLELKKTSSLRKSPNYDLANEIVVDAYASRIKKCL